MTAIQAGNRRYWERVRAGLVVHRGGGSGRRKWQEPVEIARARVMVNKAIMAAGTPATEFAEIRLDALRIAKYILRLPNALEDFDGDHSAHHKRLTLQARMAESMIADCIKVDDQALRHQERSDVMELLRQKVAAHEAKLPKPR